MRIFQKIVKFINLIFRPFSDLSPKAITILIIGVIVVFGSLKLNHTFAANYPADVNSYLTGYDNAGESQLYALNDWVSEQGNQAVDNNYPVSSGTTDLALQLNDMIFVYHSLLTNPALIYPSDGVPNATVQHEALAENSYVDSAVLTSTSGNTGATLVNSPAGQTQTLGYTAGTRFWGTGIDAPLDFNIQAPAGGFTDPVTLMYLTITYQKINNWQGNAAGGYYNNPREQFQCGGNGIYTNSATDYNSGPNGACSQTSVTYEIEVDVTPGTTSTSPNPSSSPAPAFQTPTGSCNIGATGGFWITGPVGSNFNYTVFDGAGKVVSPGADLSATIGPLGYYEIDEPYVDQYANSDGYWLSMLSDTGQTEYSIFGPCSPVTHVPPASCSDAITDSASAPVVVNGGDFETNYTYIASQGGYVATLQYVPINDTFTSMQVQGTFPAYPTADVPLSGGGSTAFETFNAAYYNGFQSVTFGGTATYTGQATWTYTNQNGQSTQEIASQTLTEPVTIAGLNPIAPCVLSVSCPNAGSASAETGQPFQMSLSENYQTGGAGGAPPSSASGDAYDVAVSTSNGTVTTADGNMAPGPNDVINSAYTTTGSGNSSAVTYDPPSWVGSQPVLGETVTWYLTSPASVPGDPPSLKCTQSFTVANDPFLSVTGGDVMAGSGIGDNCTPDISAGIAAFNDSATDGAGTDLAAFAYTVIDEFDSSNGESSPSGATYQANAPEGLSFANNTGYDGGDFGAAYCAPDYYTYASTKLDIPQTGGGSETIANPGAGHVSYSSYSGNVTLSGISGLEGQDVILVNGNVELTGNISFGPGPWASAGDLPSLYIIANGNIYIDSNVSSIAGVYEASSNSTTSDSGNIYTCADPGFNNYPSGAPSAVGGDSPDELFQISTCENTLNVDGSLISGSHIYFERVAGSADNGIPAETFNYDALFWLANPLNKETALPATPYIFSETALPPVL
jgi:hypothetical protein